MNKISLEDAKQLGYTELYFTWLGIGDNIGLMHVAEVYYQRYGKRLLISTNTPELYDYCDFAHLIDGYDFIPMNNETAQKTQLLTQYNINPIFICATDFEELFYWPGSNRMIWPKTHIFARYCELLGLSGKIQIDPKIILNKKEQEFGKFFKNNQIAIMSSGMQRYKTWSISKTQELVNTLKDHYNFVQIGTRNDLALKNVLDKRGNYSLRQVAGILYNSILFVGSIGGLMHLARAVGCRSVIAYSTGEPIYYDRYPCNENVLPKESCTLCGDRLRDPQHEACYNGYSCVVNIDAQDMIRAVENIISDLHTPLRIESVNITADKADGLKDLYLQRKTIYYKNAGYKI